MHVHNKSLLFFSPNKENLFFFMNINETSRPWSMDTTRRELSIVLKTSNLFILHIDISSYSIHFVCMFELFLI